MDLTGPPPAGLDVIQKLITRIINLSVPVGFIALTVVLLWAGFKFLMSAGDPKAIAQAWQIVTWALLGMFFLAMAWLILVLFQVFTGVPLTQFCLGFPGAPTRCP